MLSVVNAIISALLFLCIILVPGQRSRPFPSAMDFGGLLAASLSPDQRTREGATCALEQAAQDNFPLYVGMLCRELCDESRNSETRQAAGVALKNALVSKDSQRREEFGQRWLVVEGNVREKVKSQLLGALGSRDVRAGTAAAQAIAAVAYVELPIGAWPELLAALLTNVQAASENLRRCSIEAIGFICEEIEPANLEAYSNQIMTAVANGLRVEEPSLVVRAAAARAMLNCLEFARNNFHVPSERDAIIGVICRAIQANDESIVLPAFESLIRVMQLYYSYMKPYMEQIIMGLTIMGMQAPDDNVKLQAIEFWSTVCDVEKDLQEVEEATATNEDVENLEFARKALPHLLPALLALLCHTEEEEDPDEWNPAMAAGTCLSLLAECVNNNIFDGGIVMGFVERHIGSPDWRNREAAVMAFGSVMDGPKSDKMSPYIQHGLPKLLEMTADPSVAVRDTTVWAIGRTIDFFYELVPISLFPMVVTALTSRLKDKPRVAVNCCWSLMSLYVHLGDDTNETQTSVLSNQFEMVVASLFEAAQRVDSDENNLKSAAYQSLASVVLFAPLDCIPAVKRLQEVAIVQQSESQKLADQILSIEDRLRYSELQAHLCVILQNSIKKLGRPSLHEASQIMHSIFSIFQNATRGKGTASELEDALLLVGTLVSEMETDFIRFLPDFIPLLSAAISNHAEYHLCMVAIGVVGDLARALSQTLFPYCNGLMELLLSALQDQNLGREVKPHIISAIGDVAIGIGGIFATYLQPTMILLNGATELRVTDPEDYDEVDFVCDLREALLDAYTSIVQGLKEDQQAVVALYSYVQQIVQIVAIVAQEAKPTDTMVRSAVGLIGDLADTYKGEMSQLLRSDWILQFLHKILNDQSASESTISVAKWTQSVIRQVA